MSEFLTVVMIDLMVDDTVVLQDMTDSGGDYSGNFVVPQATPAGNRFLTAVDANASFAGSILVVPEPQAGPAAVVALAVLVSMRALRTRRRRMGLARLQ